MKIVVCIKHILDPELPPSAFELDDGRRSAKVGKSALVLDPYSGNALEMALQIKNQNDAVHVVALSYGGKKTEDSLRKALGVLADEAIHVVDQDENIPDAYGTARVLAAAIKKIEPVDLVLCGRQAGDWDDGMVGPLVAEYLEKPCVCFANKLDVSGDKLTVTRFVEDGTQVLEAVFPIVVTVTNDEKNVIRIGKVRNVMKAHRKPIEQMVTAELILNDDDAPKRRAFEELIELYQPVRESICEIVEGENPEEKAIILLEKLKARKAL
jgi:electron transfer flavoprotein beta subunit